MKNVPDKKLNILKVLFDIKPVDGSGRVNLQKIAAVSPKLDLRLTNKDLNNDNFFFGTRDETAGVEDLALIDTERQAEKGKNQALLLEKYLNSNLNIGRELKNVGGKTIVRKEAGKPRIRPISRNYELRVANYEKAKDRNLNFDEEQKSILTKINERIIQDNDGVLIGEPPKINPFEWTLDVKPSPEIESWIQYAKSETNFKIRILPILYKIKDFRKIGMKLKLLRLNLALKLNRKKLTVIAVIGASILIFISFGKYGISVKNEVVKESNSAVANLEKANENLKIFDFEAASNNFSEAYEKFSKAGNSLNFMGASITSLFAELPGAGKLKLAKNLVEAGKLLAESGKSMSEAVSSISQTGSVFKISSLDLDAGSDILGDLKRLLLSSKKNLSKAKAILSEVGLDALPEDKQESFSEFRSKLPELEDIISDAVEFASFLENLLGSNSVSSLSATESKTKNYLILFQNNSELRPTGGFPGTYAVVTFKNGRLAGFFIDDVYNLDGQLKENVIPPKPLQHITPNWGMRDANWFIDFSISAQKIIQFYEMATQDGYRAGPSDQTSNWIDGVITMSPRIISDILKVVGPIEMPEYGFAVNDENFLSTVQAEVEYGDNREQPKRVLLDMAPRLLESMYSSDPGQWLDIFNVFVSGLDKKDILMYFKDLNLEQFVAEKGFGGLVKNTREDYLMVTFTNVKGSKTDRVTDNSIKVSTRFEGGRMIHKLELTRQHNGGSTKYGFYNKQNPAYVRVLVPDGSELLSISGNSDPDFTPLISYSATDFKQDDDLFKFESGFRFDSKKKVSIYTESGKTGFAFWFITDPGKQKTVELEYVVPVPSRNIYIQKQPGLEVDNFEFRVGNAYIYNGEFDKDLELRFKAE